MKTDKISPTFCALPWLHLSSRPDGKMRTCCTYALGTRSHSSKNSGGEVCNENNDGVPELIASSW